MSEARIIESAGAKVYFGTRLESREDACGKFHKKMPAFLKQTHSDTIHHVPADWQFFGAHSDLVRPEGDALISNDPRTVLGVVTADCLPILVYDPVTHWMAAIHAGWRGVKKRIVPKTMAQLIEHGISISTTRLWIGPHIHTENFEVGLDIAQELAASATVGIQAVLDHPNGNKRFVDLVAIVKSQLAEFKISSEQIWIDPRDTFTDHSLTSYRREGSEATRMVSLIGTTNP